MNSKILVPNWRYCWRYKLAHTLGKNICPATPCPHYKVESPNGTKRSEKKTNHCGPQLCNGGRGSWDKCFFPRVCANLYLQPTHSKEKLAKNDTGHTGNEISFCTHAFQCGRPARLSWLVLFPHELLCDLSALRLLQEAHMHTHTHTRARKHSHITALHFTTWVTQVPRYQLTPQNNLQKMIQDRQVMKLVLHARSTWSQSLTSRMTQVRSAQEALYWKVFYTELERLPRLWPRSVYVNGVTITNLRPKVCANEIACHEMSH